MELHDMPAINASLNSLSTLFILTGWWLIRNDRTKPHIVAMTCALVTSTLFLAGYLYYHFNVQAVTRFPPLGAIRVFYLVILASHVILAIAVLPMVILTLIPALRARYDKHRRIARWTMPVWLYVSVTGVLVYMMLYQWFPASKYSPVS
jgi:putative membrane protein